MSIEITEIDLPRLISAGNVLVKVRNDATENAKDRTFITLRQMTEQLDGNEFEAYKWLKLLVSSNILTKEKGGYGFTESAYALMVLAEADTDEIRRLLQNIQIRKLENDTQ